MFKASDFVKGKMNEIFMEAHGASAPVKHQNFGEFELISSMKLDGMIYLLQTLVSEYLYLAKTEFGYSWRDASKVNGDSSGDDISSVESAKEARVDLNQNLTDSQLNNLFSLDGYHFKTRSDALDAFIAKLAGITDVDHYAYKDPKAKDIH
jgi:hypothetical protein